MSVLDLDRRTIEDTISCLVHGPDSIGRLRTYAAGRVDPDIGRRTAYSYGRHFPLFHFIPRRYRAMVEGEWRTVDTRRAPLFIVNGDRWPGSNSRTTDHQRMTRDAIAGTGIASIVLPFSALEGAGIELDSIRPLHVRPDATWEETVERRTLAEVPQWRRTYSVQVERTAATLADVPARHARTWRYVPGTGEQWTEATPADDGLFHWFETESRDIAPDADGIYRYQETRHRLGDALFTAVRQGKRSRYLSSFDTNENPPLYFLCEVPRSGHPSVEGAIDSLAPRAVHVAQLNGREVRRQGDIFLVDTELTRADLAERGATFGRFTQWSRGARARAGEITYRAPNRDRERATAVRENRHARRLWRETFQGMTDRAMLRTVDRTAEREANREQWRAMLARHAYSVTMYGADTIEPCEHCHATAGEPCRFVPADFPIERLRGTACHGARSRITIGERNRRERDELRRNTRPSVNVKSPPYPCTPNGNRRRYVAERERYARELALAREGLRLAVFGAMPRGYGVGGRPYGYGAMQYRHWTNRNAVQRARERYETVLARGVPRDSSRDAYRKRYGTTAVAVWQQSKHAAQIKYRPETIVETNRARSDRETVRRHLAVYGTAHTATEVARVGSAVYVRGTVRHAVDLETGRRGGPDHRPITLTADRWYLAVRNTVPRQSRRRARRATAA